MTDESRETNRYGITRRKALAAGSGLVVGVAGCLGDDDSETDDGEDDDGSEDGAGSDEYTVSATFLAVWDLTHKVAGEHMTVVDLVPIGAHGHDFDPDTEVVSQIESSDVFVYLRDFSSWQDDTAAELEREGDVHVIEAAEGIEFFDSPVEDDDEHFWMDPVTCQEAVDNIADALSEIDPDNAENYEANAAAFNEELQAVHEEFEAIVDRAETNQLIVGTHDSFQWWHDRYGLDIHSPIGTSPDNEPSPQEVDDIESVMEDYDLEYVLYDVGESNELAERLADETDAEILPISPVETQLPDYHEQDWGYVDHYREINFPTLETALGAQDN